MGCYLFQNGSVYVLMEGRTECVPRDEFVASFVAEDKNAHVLVAEADGPLLMEHVRQIRQIFPKGRIKTCAAYATALRAFLQTRGLVTAGESCLVADDLGDKFLLTASNGHQMAVTRAILSRDPAKVVDEIRRTQKSVMEKDGLLPQARREPIFRILSNNADVIDALDVERKKEAVFFGMVFPAFEVLGRIKFPVQLMSPEELVMQKQLAYRQELAAAWVIAVLAVGLGALCFSYAQAKEGRVVEKFARLVRDKAGLEHEEQELSVATYQDRLKALPGAVFFEVAAQFLACLPPDGRVEHVSFKREPDMRWRFTGMVSFPRQEVFPFACDGIFKEARVEHVFIQARPRMRVGLMLSDAQKEGVLP
jgi:hypothetical protein